MFVVPAQVLAADGASLGTGHVVELSPGGVRVDTGIALGVGQEIEVVFRLPGAKDPFRSRAVVRWRQDPATGLELVGLDPARAQLLADMVKPMGSAPR